MSRKALFANLLGAKDPQQPPETQDTSERVARLPNRPILGAPELIKNPAAAPVGALSQSLSEFKAQAERAAEIEKRLAEGQTIVDLDPALVDPSFVADRFGTSDEAHRRLVESIREHGQQAPILVRPHPVEPGRYQAAYGHRRLRAAAELARPVRAVVRALSDEALVIAQGQENNERQDLSFIEKARFARLLEERGFRRDTIMSALCVYKSDLSNMLSVVTKIPPGVVEGIGPAPAIGRRGWIELAEGLTGAETHAAVMSALAAPDFSICDSDERFRRALAAVKPPRDKTRFHNWKGDDGASLVKIAENSERISVTVDRRKAAAFGDFLLERLPALYEEFKSRR